MKLLKLLLTTICTVFILAISNNLKTKAQHKNNLINKFCIASLKSKLKLKDKKKVKEVSDFTCQCFLEKYYSGFSLKESRHYCRDKALVKYNL
mgnify:CR=1 FL=1